MYNYRNEIRNDIIEVLKNDEWTGLEDVADVEAFAEWIEENAWIDDTITGNASGSYTFNSYKAKEYVVENIDAINEMARGFGIDAGEIGERFINEEWEWFDVSIRCYFLDEVAADVAEDLWPQIEAEREENEAA